MDTSNSKVKSVIAFLITFILGFIIGYNEISASSNNFRDAYAGIWSFIVGSEIWVSGISAAIVWLAVVIGCSIIAVKVVKLIKFPSVKINLAWSANISLAFALMCVIVLLSVFNMNDTLDTFENLKYYKYFKVSDYIAILSQFLNEFIPIACIIMLIINRKKDVRIPAYVFLLVCGIVTTTSFILNFSSAAKQISILLKTDDKSTMVALIVSMLGDILKGILLIFVTISIKRKESNNGTKLFTILYAALSLARLILSIFSHSVNINLEMSIIDSLMSIILAAALLLLPDTLNGDGMLLNADSLKILGYVTAFILILIIFSSLAFGSDSSSCGHPGCKENGPFPCYGKNNTCTNTTDCCYDLYCDWCD